MLTDDEVKVFESIQAGETDKALELIRSGDVRINCLDKNGMNFLDQAAFKGNERLAEALIELKADADNRKHSHGYTSLMFAALSGKPRLCEMLLNAGARTHAVSNLGKTATEMAAFVGNFECVSMINSYISYEDVDILVHPNGNKSEKIYPKEFVDYIHRLTRTHFIHPVAIVNSLLTTPSVLEHRKKLVFTVDQLFEKQLRSKQPNEVMSLKLWIVLTNLREVVSFLQTKSTDTASSDELKQTLRLFIKQVVEWKNVEGKIYRKKLERFLATVIGGFPYRHSLTYKALTQSMKQLEFGRAPSTFAIICATIFGQRYAQAAFCSYCGQVNAAKCCSICKVLYCSTDCQKLDWSSHKKVCAALKANPQQNAYLKAVLSDEITSLMLNDSGKDAPADSAQQQEA